MLFSDKCTYRGVLCLKLSRKNIILRANQLPQTNNGGVHPPPPRRIKKLYSEPISKSGIRVISIQAYKIPGNYCVCVPENHTIRQSFDLTICIQIIFRVVS